MPFENFNEQPSRPTPDWQETVGEVLLGAASVAGLTTGARIAGAIKHNEPDDFRAEQRRLDGSQKLPAIDVIFPKNADIAIWVTPQGPTDEDRQEAVSKSGKSLAALGKETLQRMKEDGFYDTDGAGHNKQLRDNYEKLLPVAEDLQSKLLKGELDDFAKALHKLDPSTQEKVAKIIQTNLDRMHAGIDLDIDRDSILIVSNKAHNGRGILIAPSGKTDVIGIEPDGSYDYRKHFKKEDAAAEFKGVADNGVTNIVRGVRDDALKLFPFVPKIEPNKWYEYGETTLRQLLGGSASDLELKKEEPKQEPSKVEDPALIRGARHGADSRPSFKGPWWDTERYDTRDYDAIPDDGLPN